MTHTFAYVSVDEAQALFECSVCHRQIGFVLPGLGEPHAIPDGDAYVVPDGADAYLEPCTVAEPTPIPQVITKRQFLIELLREGMVTEAEVPMLAVTPPASINTLFAGLPTEAGLEVILTWASMTEVERHNPLIDMAVAGGVMTDPDLDAFFIAAAQI